jgi:hypothetical protein
VHPRGESKKFNNTKGESKEKKNIREKTKLTHITGILTILPSRKMILKYCGIAKTKS